ncbi:MAG: fimbria major subunit [Bacteroidales bacterium]|nr:fimbria major subunit [Bacteroidales bacterium]
MDNGDNKAMGAMEFAVVRNNVYKLCVDYINKLGHPTPGTPDPDPIEPGDPDESGEYYFGVTAKVVPWVVRVNHIGW